METECLPYSPPVYTARFSSATLSWPRGFEGGLQVFIPGSLCHSCTKRELLQRPSATVPTGRSPRWCLARRCASHGAAGDGRSSQQQQHRERWLDEGEKKRKLDFQSQDSATLITTNKPTSIAKILRRELAHKAWRSPFTFQKPESCCFWRAQ